jgi:biopolymer transport protein ExbD
MRRWPKDEEHVGELNLIPYLDVVTNLIMFLMLSITGLISLGVVNVSAPRIAETQVAQAVDPNAPKLLLTVAISKTGFYIAGAGGVLGGPPDQANVDATQPPTVPLRANGQHDYEALTALLAKIKEHYPLETNLILSADADIPYDILIRTMDASREVKVKLGDVSIDRKPLFFDVSLSLVG